MDQESAVGPKRRMANRRLQDGARRLKTSSMSVLT